MITSRREILPCVETASKGSLCIFSFLFFKYIRHIFTMIWKDQRNFSENNGLLKSRYLTDNLHVDQRWETIDHRYTLFMQRYSSSFKFFPWIMMHASLETLHVFENILVKHWRLNIESCKIILFSDRSDSHSFATLWNHKVRHAMTLDLWANWI